MTLDTTVKNDLTANSRILKDKKMLLQNRKF